jgi:hypothetical protein
MLFASDGLFVGLAWDRVELITGIAGTSPREVWKAMNEYGTALTGPPVTEVRPEQRGEFRSA